MSAHERWFIIHGAEKGHDCIRCECGDTFSGFIALSKHWMAGAVAVTQKGKTQ